MEEKGPTKKELLEELQKMKAGRDKIKAELDKELATENQSQTPSTIQENAKAPWDPDYEEAPPRRTVEEVLGQSKPEKPLQGGVEENPFAMSKEELAEIDLREQRYKNAVKIVQEMGRASTAVLQRRLRIGNGEATRMIEKMRREGIIDQGPAALTPLPDTAPAPLPPPLPPVGFINTTTPEVPRALHDRPLTREEQVAYTKLKDARKAYVDEYKKFMDSRSTLQRAGNFVFGARYEKDPGAPNGPLETLEAAYDKAAVEYGNAMLQAYTDRVLTQEAVVAPAGQTVTQVIDAKIAHYKQNNIFNEVIVREQEELLKLKVESLPPKKRGIIGKGFDWYINLPTWQKRALSISLSTGFSAGVAYATGGSSVVGAAIVKKLARTAGGVAAAQGVSRLIDKTLGATLEENIMGSKNKLKALDLSNETNFKDVKKNYKSVLENEKLAKRTLLAAKAAAGMLAGVGGSVLTGELVGDSSFSSRPRASAGPTVTESSDKSGDSGNITEPNTPTETPKLPESAEPKIIDPSTKQEIPVPKPTPPHPATSPTPLASATPSDPGTPIPQSPSGPSAASPAAGINPEAVVHNRQGITQAFAAQMKDNPALAKELGFDGDLNNSRDIAKFTKELAVKTGYINAETGAEVRVAEADKVAYELRVENGKIVVDEKLVASGKVIESHTEDTEGAKFGSSKASEYEYKAKRVPIISEKILEKTEEDLLPSPRLKEADIPLETQVPVREQATGSGNSDLLGPEEKPLDESLLNPQEKLKTVRQRLEANIETRRPREIGGDIRPREALESINTSEKILAENPILRKAGFETLDDAARTKAWHVYQENIRNIRNTSVEYQDEWTGMQNASAHVAIEHLKDGNYIDSPLMKYLKLLHDETKLEPQKTWFTHTWTVNEYIARALKKAAEMGKLDRVTLR